MRNIGTTAGYRAVDHVASAAARSLSRVVGVRNVTRPFWNRWRASFLGDEALKEFLASIKSIDDWPVAAIDLVGRAERDYAGRKASLSPTARVAELRRLSYLCHMAQWGCMEISASKKRCYQMSRDFYIESERLAFGKRYRRVGVPGYGLASQSVLWGNLHLPEGEGPYPVLIVFHGMDDTKEEHLQTELALLARGFAVFGFDGPGQGEALYMERLHWSHDFHRSVHKMIDLLSSEHSCDPSRVGLIGISWGGLWAVKAAAEEPRVKAVYDLGGPVDSVRFPKLPFFLKSKFAQVLGVERAEDLHPEASFTLRTKGALENVRCALRIVHGDVDPLVRIEEKEWLKASLLGLHPEQDISILRFETGDHCCTGQIPEIRQDAADFFARVLHVGGAK
jgi:pimeloyl-ACP methyl ester carboxylesterase